jgi:H+/Cl- antiporter ClcA
MEASGLGGPILGLVLMPGLLAAGIGSLIFVGLAAALVGSGIRWLGLRLQPYSQRWPVLVVPMAGLVVAELAIAYAEGAGKSSSEVLFSGQTALEPLITHSASYTVGALLLLLVCKSLAYGVSLSSFRGGPVFPSLFVGAVGGMALSHLPGLPLVAWPRFCFCRMAWP